jgi:methionyl-tRNA formyltransferase
MDRILYLGQNHAVKSIIGLEKLIEASPNSEYLILIGQSKQQIKQKQSRQYKIYKRFYDDFSIDLPFQSLEEVCRNKNIPYIISENPRKIQLTTEISTFSPDFLISNGWGWIIPDEFIDLPRIKALNCHSSLLPKYKGPSVYRHVLMNFEKNTGLSVHEITPQIDEGDVYASKKLDIDKKDTPTSLLYKLSLMSGEVIREAMDFAAQNKIAKTFENQGFYVRKASLKDYIIYRTFNRIRKVFFLEPKRYLLK